jgi:hypothetical protein
MQVWDLVCIRAVTPTLRMEMFNKELYSELAAGYRPKQLKC